MPQFSQPRTSGGTQQGGGISGGNSNGMNKKKFGKNLNHALSKPAAPPIPSDRSSQSARNGLLLLSTKKSSGGLLASKTNATISTNNNASNGINGGHAKPGGGSSLNLQTQPNPSTHEVLLSAVVGASQADTQQKLDAWGVADQIKEQQQTQYDISQNEEKYPEHDHENDSREDWGDYGGRGRSESVASDSYGGEKTDDQVAYMSRLARERAQIKSQEEELRSAEQKAKAAKRLKDLEQKKSTESPEARGLWEPAGKNGKETSKGSIAGSVKSDKDADDSAAEPVIHLSSYEDRDRGERVTSAAPRMLFDPKSGSMVAVKAKPEPTGGGKEKPRKERKPKTKKERESAPVVVIKNGRGIKQKGPRKETSGTAAQYEKKKANPTRRYPRTRGVLYRRDGKGKLRSVDECGGDLDFGLHSVPGGRMRNPEAYSAWSEQSELSYGGDDYGAGDMHLVGFGDSGHGVTLETGFTPEPEEHQPVMEWIKAEDKIELITGVDDSPTLKPTAKVFAPSEAALAAAALAATSVKDYSDASSLVDTGPYDDESEDEEESEQAEDDGLYFDPLHGIDFMGDPHHHKSPEEIATADLPPLGLDRPMFSGDDTGLSRPLFGFGTTSTWGGSNQMNDDVLSGWGSGTGGVGLFGSDVFRQGEKDSEPAQFLTSTSSNWGSSSVPGLDRLPAINVSEHATGPAD